MEGKKAKTLRWYQEILTPFVAFVDREGLTRASLRKYVNSLFDRLEMASIDTHVRAIKTFPHFLYEEGHIEEDLAATLKRPRLPKQFPMCSTTSRLWLCSKRRTRRPGKASATTSCS
ncbi:hypothetical protein ACP6EK_08155 [Candidatus Caldatribacterium sp. SIUC1]|uniref:hypothetical protein n=1 Tax=Candidatus Caldatribacterium sp. SIUC1 TaxID=3418365 RepID=UPI003F68F629